MDRKELREVYYVTDFKGTFYPRRFPRIKVNKLNCPILKLGEGLTSSYLYLKDYGATFAWHVEDLYLNSIFYLHEGAEKMW